MKIIHCDLIGGEFIFTPPLQSKPSVVTVGSYDGFHLGHKRIISAIQSRASQKSYQSIVVTFDIHPRFLLQHKEGFKILSTKSETIEKFELSNIDTLIFVNFNFEFSEIEPKEYIEKFIIGKLHTKHLVVGYDHQFGKNRVGNISMLKEYETKGQFELTAVEEFSHDGHRISSTTIRTAIQESNFTKARVLLGELYHFSGMVMEGNKRGRTIGFPTANLQVDERKQLPSVGVYAVNVTWKGNSYKAMMNIGTTPTFTDEKIILVEVHIFDFNFVIYGEKILVEPIAKIRDEKKFDGIPSLRNQLEQDKENAKKLLNQSIKKN